MASLVCTTAFQLEQLVAIMDSNEGRYNTAVAVGPANFPPYIRLFQSYALGELHGVVDYFLYTDPNGKQYPAIGIFTAIAALEDSMIANAFQFQYMAYSINTLEVLLQLRQNALQAQAIGYTQGLYWSSIRHADALNAQAVSYAQGLYWSSIGHADSLYNAAIRYTQALQADAVGRATAQFNAAMAHSDGLFNDSIGYTNVQANEVRAQLAGVQASLTSLVGTDVTSLTKQIADTANKAEQEVRNAVAQAEQFATEMSAGAGAAAVAKVVAQLQPQLDALKTETTECLAPLCDTVTPNARQLGNLGKLLSGLADASLLGLLLALLAEAAHDPGRVVADAENDLAGIVNGTVKGLRDLIGV